MGTIQNLKNFIRHGKHARLSGPHGEPTTNVSAVHAEHQRQPQGQYGAAAGGLDNIDAKVRSAKSNSGADSVPKQQQQQQQQPVSPNAARRHEQEVEQIVAEEKLNRDTIPTYPGLERWVIVEKMGDGAFSNVYRARDTQGKENEVAIKVVRKFEMNSKQRANILKEVQIMRQLDHPHVVRLIEFSESPRYYYIVLELCPGGELFHQIVRLTYFSENLSRHVILQVAKAIEYLHERSGVVHRDIKPENLLFYPTKFIPSKNPKPPAPGDEDKVDEGEFIPGVGSGSIGQIKVADFGLSKVIWDNDTVTPCGTVGYTAPEIVKDERYSKSVDMWALGCVLYTLLCGFPPFYDESIQVLTEKVARGQYTFLSPWWDDISKSAQDLVSHLLTVDPEKRITIQQFLNHPWIRESDEETTAAADAPPLATPLVTKSQLLETPLSAPGDKRYDFRSPAAINLREVFDVGYAVHRQEEETKRRKNFRHGYRGTNAPLNPLNEYDDSAEEEEPEEIIYDHDNNSVAGPSAHPSKVPRAEYSPAEVSNMERQMRATNIAANTQPSAAAQARDATIRSAKQPPQQQQQKQQQKQRQQAGGYGQHSAAVAAAARQNAARTAQQPFELSLDNATLLGRRGRRSPPGQTVV